MKIPFKVVCVDDKNRPNDIPLSSWVKEQNIYTVIEVSVLRMQNGHLGFKLEEINIDHCFPYQYFSSSRFVIILDEEFLIQLEAEKLLKEAEIEFSDSLILTNDSKNLNNN